MVYFYPILILFLLVITVSKYKINLTSPIFIFCSFFTLKYITRPFILTLYPDTLKHKFLFSQDLDILMSETLLMYSLLLLIFFMGYIYPIRINLNFGNIEFHPRKNLVSPNFIILILLVISGITTFGLIISSGGIVQFIYASRHGLFETSSYALQKFPSIILMLITLNILLTSLSKYSILLLLTASVNSLLYGERGTIVICIIVLVFASLHNGRMKKTKFFVYLLISAVLLYALGEMRTYAFNVAEENSEKFITETDYVFTLLYSLSGFFNLETYDHFLVVYQNLGQSLDYRLGYDFYLGLIGVIPRFLWESKPQIILLGGWFAEHYMPGTGGKPITAIGDYYINFGFIGAAFIMFFVGRVIRLFGEQKSSIAFSFFLIYFFFFTAFGIPGQNLFMISILNGVPVLSFIITCYKLKIKYVH